MKQDPLACIEWPRNPTVESLGKAIGDCCGLKIALTPIPEHLRRPQLSGLTITVGETAHVYYDSDLSPLNRIQTIMHEYAHILHGDVRANTDSTHARTVFDNPAEERAERTGMRLMAELRRKQRNRSSDILEFFTGNP